MHGRETDRDVPQHPSGSALPGGRNSAKSYSNQAQADNCPVSLSHSAVANQHVSGLDGRV